MDVSTHGVVSDLATIILNLKQSQKKFIWAMCAWEVN